MTTVVAALLGRLAIAMWGYPLWSFAPLALLLWLRPLEPPQLRRFAAGAIAMLSPSRSSTARSRSASRSCATGRRPPSSPAELLAETITREWREQTGTPLVYVGGDR